jgi:hypothetical protein
VVVQIFYLTITHRFYPKTADYLDIGKALEPLGQKPVKSTIRIFEKERWIMRQKKLTD